MEEVVSFNDIFEEADEKLAQAADSLANAAGASGEQPLAAQVDSNLLKQFQDGILGSRTSISIFLLSLLIIATTTVYYINSYLVVRKRLKDLAAAEL